MWNIMNVFKIRVLKKSRPGLQKWLCWEHILLQGTPVQLPAPAPTPGCGTPVPGDVDLWPPRELAFTHTHT